MVPPTPLLSARSPVRALGGGKSVNPATGASSESSVPLPPSGTTLSSPQCTASRLSCGSSSSVSCSPSCCLGFRVRVGEGGGATGWQGWGAQPARWKSKPVFHSRAFNSKEASSSFPYSYPPPVPLHTTHTPTTHPPSSRRDEQKQPVSSQCSLTPPFLANNTHRFTYQLGRSRGARALLPHSI